MKKAKSKSAKKPKAATPLDAVPDRKIVQIVSGPGNGIILLCDDGTVWMGQPVNFGRVNVDAVIFNVTPPPPAIM
jgi:hypothetical protein